jgi:bacillithiol biosynthesis cysteine-adding enzyme BshC
MSRDQTTRVITEPLGGSALSRAVQDRRLPADLQLWWPEGGEAWRAHVERVREGMDRGWLERVGPAMAASGAAALRLARVAGGQGVVVTTGQQAGLFGGPLYTLAKALTAITLADAIESQLGIPAAPVFWGATDDADFLEASVANVADADGLKELRIEQRPEVGATMAVAPLGDTRAMLATLRSACGSAAHAEYYELARAAFAGERTTIGAAYIELLRGLLEPLGMAVLDSSHAALREAARPVLTQALERAEEVAAATNAAAAGIRAAGFEPQVQDERGLTLVFEVKHGVKRRLSLDDARTEPRRARGELAPNVLLRPVVERAVLPTVAYVAGPGELAYFTQSNAVAAALGQPRVVGVPRWSGTVIEPFAARALQRLGVEWHELKDLHALERRLATAALPPDVAEAWKALREQVRRSMATLSDSVQRSALLPVPVIEGLDGALNQRLQRGERRLLAAAKRKDERVRRDLGIASAALFPLGARQERVLNFIPMLARGGETLIEEMRRASAAHVAGLLRAARSEPVTAR